MKRKASPPPKKPYKMTYEIEKRIVAWLLTPPPNGRKKWSAYLLADKVVEEVMEEKNILYGNLPIIGQIGLKMLIGNNFNY